VSTEHCHVVASARQLGLLCARRRYSGSWPVLHEPGFGDVYAAALALIMQSDGVPSDLAELLPAEAAADAAYAIGRGDPLDGFRYQKPTLRRLVRTARLVHAEQRNEPTGLLVNAEEVHATRVLSAASGEFALLRNDDDVRRLWARPAPGHLYSPHGKRGYDWRALAELLHAAVAVSMSDMGWRPTTLNGRDLLSDATRQPLRTVYGHEVDAPELFSDRHQAAAVLELEPLLGALRGGEEVALTRRGPGRPTTHHVGAVLLRLPGAEALLDPPRIRLIAAAIEALKTPPAPERVPAPPVLPQAPALVEPSVLPPAELAPDPQKLPTQAPGTRWSVSVATATRGAMRAQAPDPRLVERGLRGHSQAEAALAAALRRFGTEPLSPADGEPPFDIAWVWDATLFVAEVKSVTPDNEEHQLRLGLGQLLRYVHWLSGLYPRYAVRGVLVPEQGPSDCAWGEVCRGAGVHLLPACALSESLTALKETASVERRVGASRAA